MAIEKLELRCPEGTQLFIFQVYKHPEGEHLETDAYVALKAQSAGTIYTVPAGSKVVHLRAEQAIHEGAHFYPGDPKHFGQLPERPLFFQLGVFDATEKTES